MLSQEELAERAGISRFTVQRVERGDGGVRPKTGRALAEALDVEVEELFDTPKASSPPSSPVDRFVEAAGSLERMSEEDPDKLREHITHVKENAYVFAKRYVSSLPSGLEKEKAQEQLEEGHTKLTRALMLLVGSYAGRDLEITGEPRRSIEDHDVSDAG